MEDWRDRLRAVIAKKDIRMTHLSEEMGFSRDYIGRLLKRGSNPNLRNLEKVCETLGVSFAYIYTGVQRDKVYDDVISKMSTMTHQELVSLRDHLGKHPLSSDLED